MTKIIFRKEKPNFEKHKSLQNFDAILEQHRKKAKKRLQLNIILLVIEVLLVLLFVFFAVYKLNSLQKVEKLNPTNNRADEIINIR
jgi:hypothetical protein